MNCWHAFSHTPVVPRLPRRALSGSPGTREHVTRSAAAASRTDPLGAARLPVVTPTTGPGDTSPGSPGRSLVLLLAAVLTAILTLLVGPVGAANAVTATASGTITAAADNASGHTGPAAETRVGASTLAVASLVGAADGIAAGQRRGNVLPQPVSALATSVAAETGLGPLEQGAAKVPSEWGPGAANSKGVGTRWTDPANQGNGVRIDQGSPSSGFPSQQVDHVVVRSGGNILGPDGKPIVGSLSENPQAHIPLSDWLNWSSWNAP